MLLNLIPFLFLHIFFTVFFKQYFYLFSRYFKNLFLTGWLHYNVVFLPYRKENYCPPPNPCLHPTLLDLHRALAKLPALYSNFPLVICFTYDDAYVSVLRSNLPLPPLCLHLFQLPMTNPANVYIQQINKWLNICALPLRGSCADSRVEFIIS